VGLFDKFKKNNKGGGKYEAFKSFVGMPGEENYSSTDEFLNAIEGKTFLNGMLRIFNSSEKSKWRATVEEAFPAYKGRADVFAYDWFGRIFANDPSRNMVLIFEPGTGDVFDVDADIVDFFETEIPKYPEDALLSSFFEEWFNSNEQYILAHNECVGYKVPLFLNGDDKVENLEVSDMEVYWVIMGQLLNK